MWLLPSGPDQVGEALARANLSAPDIGKRRGKHNPSERQSQLQKPVFVVANDIWVVFFKFRKM